MVSYAQASCTGSNVAAVSEKGDLLLYSVSAITSELQQVINVHTHTLQVAFTC